jgi:hypothetical protein
MFFMQSASFLSFQRALEKGQGRSNCQSLFGIEKIPSDKYIRDMLDEADPAQLAPCFERLEALLPEPPLRQAFGRLGGRTLVAWDGTEFFCSQKLGCPPCLTRKRPNGKVESYHSMFAATVVARGHAKIMPLMPEFMAPQDGPEKQDCERNAVKRWFGTHQARLAPLRPVYLGDDLFACRWFEAVPLRGGKDAMLINWIGFEIIDAKGRVKYSMAWVTRLAVTNETSPRSSPAAGRAGRSRTKAST